MSVCICGGKIISIRKRKNEKRLYSQASGESHREITTPGCESPVIHRNDKCPLIDLILRMISGLGEVVAGLVPKRFAHAKEEKAHPNSGRKYHCKVGNVREFRLFVLRSELDMTIAPRQPDDEEGKDWVRGCIMWCVRVEVERFDSTRVSTNKRRRSAVGKVCTRTRTCITCTYK